MVEAQSKRVGQQTVQFERPPAVVATMSIVGPKEGQGPLADTFDKILENDYYEEKSWEKAECKMLQEVVEAVLKKMQLVPQNIDYLLAGDLNNQIISANYAARFLGIPFLGLYGACSTMLEGLALASILIDGGFANTVVAATSSHYSTAERQFRFPTEQGTQRPLSSQWTVTGAAALMLGKEGTGPRVTYATVGKVVDLGEKNAHNLGSAMAPAAVDTIIAHFQDTGRGPQDYDLIVTGDLGSVGKTLALELAKRKGYDLSSNLEDCGVLIFDQLTQDTHAGGSGCAASGVVTAGYLYKRLIEGRYQRVLNVGTGALISTTSLQQGESIPAIGHAVSLELVT